MTSADMVPASAPGSLLWRIASDEILQEAYRWLCKRRKRHHYNSDVWHLRHHWQGLKPVLQETLRQGAYRLSPVRKVHTPDGDFSFWASQDALVLKAVAIVLGEELRPRLSTRCFHLPGKGGGKGAVRAVQKNVGKAAYVFRSDVKHYYASMDHAVLLRLVSGLVSDTNVLALIDGYLHHLVDEDGVLSLVEKGISYGCPLSPLMGAIYLKPLDDALARQDVFYVRYVDDWVVLAKSRWKLRSAVRAANSVLGQLQVEKHPLKTFIGRASHGFDFLGYRFPPGATGGLEVARQTLCNHVVKIARLYEQGAGFERIGQYILDWCRWVRAGVGLVIDIDWLRVMYRELGSNILVFKTSVMKCKEVSSPADGYTVR
jgi:RNA-directed DNA polymerase